MVSLAQKRFAALHAVLDGVHEVENLHGVWRNRRSQRPVSRSAITEPHRERRPDGVFHRVRRLHLGLELRLLAEDGATARVELERREENAASHLLDTDSAGEKPLLPK